MSDNNIIRPMVDEVKAAAREAVQEMRGYLGQPADPDLRLYQKLQPADFQAILQQYGPENLAQYVQTMEARRLKGG